MSTIIKDGTGEGYQARVGDDNKLRTRAVIETVEHNANIVNESAFHALFDQTPTGANDCFFYMKNEDQDQDIVIEGIDFYAASSEQIEIYLDQSGTPSGGSDITPVNCNSGSAISATGDFQQGSDITGLSGGSVVQKWWISNSETLHYNFENDIVLVPNATLTMYAVTGSINVAGTVVFFYQDEEEVI